MTALKAGGLAKYACCVRLARYPRQERGVMKRVAGVHAVMSICFVDGNSYVDVKR